MGDRTIGRAAFLGVLTAGVAGLFVGRDVTGALERLVPDRLSALAPSSGWRIYWIADRMPDVDPGSYRLAIDGEVREPLALSLGDLDALPRVRQVSDFHCVTGWSVEDVRWEGVRVSDLLDRAGPLAGARWLRFVSAERPYDDTLTVEQARLPDVLLATAMDGKPLSRPHGAPVRLVVPRMYGYKSVKWVERIEVLRDFRPGYWEQHGYDADAWVGSSNGRGFSG